MALLSAMMEVRPELALAGPQLSALRAADAAAPVQATARLLAYVDGMFNFADNKRLNTLQVSMLANDLVQRYWRLKFDELVYVLREGANGRYHTFDRIDAGVIHGWFAEYLAERDALLEVQIHNEHVAYQERAVQVAKDMPISALYVRQKCAGYHPSELLRLQRWVAGKWPAEPLLAQAVNDYDAELWRKERLAAAKLAEARGKARLVLAEFAQIEQQWAAAEMQPEADAA
ncbi:hypothetical protein D0N36_06825 [Hymenobacter lapidiphilus]|nr:hypothetical protein D0N36_06825 [Hymenobacter sp. CCM 8763]